MVSDLGATLGRTGSKGKHSKNNLYHFVESAFVESVEDGRVRFQYDTRPSGWALASIVYPPYFLREFQREDLFEEGEYADVEKQLHRHVLYQAEEGDIVVVDARGDMSSGIFGDMMMTYFKGLKGAGVVVDGSQVTGVLARVVVVADGLDDLPRADGPGRADLGQSDGRGTHADVLPALGGVEGGAVADAGCRCATACV